MQNSAGFVDFFPSTARTMHVLAATYKIISGTWGYREANRHFGRGYFARLIGTLVEAIVSLQLYKSEANRADPIHSGNCECEFTPNTTVPS